MNGLFDGKFSWCDLYSSQETTGDIQFELDCIIYNIGALHSELGSLDTRNTADSMKIACTHFQCAAWAFDQLKEHPHNYKSKDISHDVVTFMYQVMLGQAQECILEKSMLDSRKPSIITKVAAQVVEFYNSSLMVLIQGSLNGNTAQIGDIVGSRLLKNWKRLIEFKISYFNAICNYYMGAYSEELQKMGERIAWYMAGQEHLKQAEKLIKSGNKTEISELISALDLLTNELNAKLEVAKKENDFVYHEPVPTSDKLTAVKGVLLVKGISFSVTDPEVAGNDIFSKLVPIQAHEVASIYSDNKDKLLRSIRTQLEEKNEELVTYMSSLQLEKETLRPMINSVPDELIEICAALSIKPNVIKQEKASLECLEEVSQNVDKYIKEADELIAEEKEKEKRHQDRYGKRPPSLILVDLEKELKKHKETHCKAMDSNENLRQALEKYASDVQLMIDCPVKNLGGLLPSITDISFDDDNIKEIEKLLDKVQEMKDQRASLEKQLREGLQNDDVLKHVLTHSREEMDSVFDKELKKYDSLVSLLKQNMSAQENILNALTKASASYGQARIALNEVNRLRANRIKSLIHSYESFNQVTSNIEKGLEFYKNFETLIAKLLSRVKSVIKVQDEERMQFVEVQITKETKNLNNLLIGDKSNTAASTAPKLKDFLPYLNFNQAFIAPPPQPLQPQPPQPQPQPLQPLNNIPLASSTYSSYNQTNQPQLSSQLPLNPNGQPSWSSSQQYLSQPSSVSFINNDITSPSLMLGQNKQEGYPLHSQMINQNPVLSMPTNSNMSSLQQPHQSLVSSTPQSTAVYSTPSSMSTNLNVYTYQPQSTPSTYPTYSTNEISSYDNLQNSYNSNNLISQWSQYTPVIQDQSQSWTMSQQSQFNTNLTSQLQFKASSAHLSSLSQPSNSQGYPVPQNQHLLSNPNQHLLPTILPTSQLTSSTTLPNSNLQTSLSQPSQYQSNTSATMLPGQDQYQYPLADQSTHPYGQSMSSYGQVDVSQGSQMYPDYSNNSWQYSGNNVPITQSPFTNSYSNQPYLTPTLPTMPSGIESSNQGYTNQPQSLNNNEPLIPLSLFK